MRKDILDIAIENFSMDPKFKLDLDASKESNQAYNGKLLIKGSLERFDFVFKVIRRLTISKLPNIIEAYNQKYNTILVSDYIPKKVKEYLKDENISYLDIAGNAYITNGKNLYIFIENKKPLPSLSKSPTRAFSKSGLKVIFQILIDDSIVNKPYRYIGNLSKVSIDTVGKVFNELLEEKFLIQIKKREFKVQNKERLLQEWIILFNKVLRPRLNQRKFKIKDRNLAILLNSSLIDSIGGELAAEVLSNYLIAERAIIYTNQSLIETAKLLELLPSENGSVTLIEKFWTNNLTEHQNVLVNPILVYADLLSDPSPRNLETAKIIYDKYVKDIISNIRV